MQVLHVGTLSAQAVVNYFVEFDKLLCLRLKAGSSAWIRRYLLLMRSVVAVDLLLSYLKINMNISIKFLQKERQVK